MDATIRRRSFDDAQSRFKCRKVLGIGGKEPSKVLQVLGSQESYLILIPRGHDLWQFFTTGCFILFAIMWLVFPGTFVSFITSQAQPDLVISTMCCRIIGGSLCAMAAITWYTEPITMASIRNTLMLQYTYSGIATFALTWAFMTNKSKFLLVLSILHGLIALGSTYYFYAFRLLNKPTPDKPSSKGVNGDNDMNHND
ncbi:predicted protein, partial [Nematostella vectensis]